MAFISKAAISKGVTKRRREAANEEARIQALVAGEVFAPTIVRRDPSAPKVEAEKSPTQPSEKTLDAKACLDAERRGVRSTTEKTPQREHPRFPGRPANWSPNRAQRAKLRRQGLL